LSERFQGADMKRIALIAVAISLVAANAHATTIYNNFTGDSPYWHPFGNPNSATYGETFTAPTNGDNVLQSFTLYLSDSYVSGDILLNAYVASWTGSRAGTLLYTSSPVDYPNTGNTGLSFNTGGLVLTPGGSYVAFLSVSEHYGASSGEAYVSQGNNGVPGGGFVYSNNSGDFGSLFTTDWSGPAQPDFAFSATFNGAAVPEPGTLLLVCIGLVGMLGAARGRLLS
jgi:PEP-CTERM motif